MKNWTDKYTKIENKSNNSAKVLVGYHLLEKIKRSNILMSILSMRDSLTGGRSYGKFIFDYEKGKLFKYNYLLDVNNFSHVNNLIGPIGASSCLSQYVNTLKSQWDDLKLKFYRIGGDEFLISCQEPLPIEQIQKTIFLKFDDKSVEIKSTAVFVELSCRGKISMEERISSSFNELKIKKRKAKKNDFFICK